MPLGSIQPVTDGILLDLDDAAGAEYSMTFDQGPYRAEVMRLLRAPTAVGRALARRNRALTHGAQQPKNAAIGFVWHSDILKIYQGFPELASHNLTGSEQRPNRVRLLRLPAVDASKNA
jgi:hypothetical protein